MAAKGLQVLYNLILKDVVKGSGKASGILSIGSDVRKIAMNKYAKFVDSAKKQGVDLDKLSEQEIKYMLELNKPKAPQVYSNEEAYEILSRFANQNKRGQVIKADFGKPFAEEIVTVERVITDIKKLEPIEAMKEANRVLKGEGRYKSLSQADRKKIAMDESVTDHIFEREIKPDPEDFAQGGRTGLSYLLAEDINERMPFAMGRRAFLKLMGAAGAGIGAAKAGLGSLFKAGKPVAKELTQVPIKNVDGMPSWFKPLVNRVIKEGEDVTKQFATKERQIVHKKRLGGPEDVWTDKVTVTQDLDEGIVRVEYDSSTNMGEAPIQLEYKAGEIIDDIDVPKTGTIDPKTGWTKKLSDDFTAVESEPRVTSWEGDIEWDGENVVGKVDDLLSDTTELEAYATGKKPTIKKLLESQKKQKKVRKLNEDTMEQVEYIENKEGMFAEDYIDETARVSDFGEHSGYDTKGMNLPDKTKKASGGVAKLLGE